MIDNLARPTGIVPRSLLENHRCRGRRPASDRRERGHRGRQSGRPRHPRAHRQRDHRHRRGGLRTRGRRGARERPGLARDREQPARAADRREPARRRATLGQDVPRRHLRRPARDRDPRDQRDRHRALGHQGQGARQAGVRAARPRPARADPRLCLPADAGHDRGGHRGGHRAARPGLHRRQARLGAAGTRSRQRRPPGRGRPRGGRGRCRDHDRRRPRVRRRRRHGDPRGARAGAARRLLARGTLRAGRVRGLCPARRRRRADGRRRRAGRDPVGLSRADRARARRPDPARRDPVRRDHGDDADRCPRGGARSRARAARLEEWDHQGRLAPLQRRADRGALPGVLRRGDRDQHEAHPAAAADRVGRLRRGPDGARTRYRSGRGCSLVPTRGGAMTQISSDAAAALAARAAAVIPGGVNSGQRRVPGLEELVVTATSGSTFTDADGRVYTDYHAAFGPPLLGHNDPDVDAAVAGAAGLMGVGVTPVEIELAERLVAVVPSLEKVLLTATGSEATFHALRLARAVTGRRHVLKFQGCYHGWHDSVAMNVISRAERVSGKDPLSQGILPEVLDATIVCRFNDADAVEQALIDHDVAAIILEPIPHNIGTVLPKPGFLERLRELATKHGTVLVFDEVITGFRHGLGGYQAIAGVTPDLTTLGKAMANGWPVSALGGKDELMDLFSTTPGQPAFFAGTFNGHPATTSAALATLDKLQREPVHGHVFRLGERTREGLRALYARLGVPVVVSGFGSVFVTYFLEGPVESYDDLLRNDVDLFVGYRRELLHHGIFELPLNLKRSHFSYAHTDEDVDRLLEATETAVAAALAARA